MVTGSHQTLNVGYNVVPLYQNIESSSVVSASNAFLDLTPQGPYLSQSTPNLDFGSEFCQSPIIPFSGSRPPGYMAHRSSILLGNATKARKSRIYYNKLLANTNQETDY